MQIMENPTGFDLNHALRQWCETLGRSPSLGREDLEELEGHLREATAALTRQGLSEEEAWLVALRRLGGSSVLDPEFAKVNGGVWSRRLLWMLLGVQAWQVLNSAANFCAGTVGRMAGLLGGATAGAEFRTADLAVSAGFQFLVYLVVLALCLWAGWRTLGRRGAWVSTVAMRFFRRPALAVCAVPVLLLGLAAAQQLETLWLVRRVGPSALGVCFASLNLGGMAIGTFGTLLLAGLTLLVARQRLGIVTKVAAKP